MVEYSKDELTAFENEIAEIFAKGLIKAPVHLRAGREEALIALFRKHDIGPDDYVFGFWDSHELCLLKGVPREAVKQAIMEGRSIALCFPEHKVYCSGIVGSLMGTAAGAAWALKKKGKKGRVFLFCGDMSSETGIFHEAVKYAVNFDLPAVFVVSDNGLSVMTNTRESWGSTEPWFKGTRFESKIEYFQYKNAWPHSGLGKLIKF
ncbi:MAG: thiamine pyrophosphate-dependent enzyme [Candidatus Omnitrophota bacterium]